MRSKNNTILQEIKTKLDRLEELALELKEVGQGVPAVEKNSRDILSATYNLKFGISDIAEIDAA